MARFLPFGLWFSAAFGTAAIALIASYAAYNDSGHTGWEPFTALILFVPLAIVGAVCYEVRRRFTGITRASVCAVVVGLAGVIFVAWLDHTNRLVQYDRWIERGMPENSQR